MNKNGITTKKIVLSGMLAAVSIVIGLLCKKYLTFMIFIRISFDNIPIFIAGMLLGPFYAAVIAVVSDIISCLLSGTGMVNPIVTAGACVIGLIAGFMPVILKKMKLLPKTAITVFVSHIIGSMVIKSFGLHFISGMPMNLFAVRIPIYMGIAAFETFFVYLLMKNPEIKKAAQ